MCIRKKLDSITMSNTSHMYINDVCVFLDVRVNVWEHLRDIDVIHLKNQNKRQCRGFSTRSQYREYRRKVVQRSSINWQINHCKTIN